MAGRAGVLRAVIRAFIQSRLGGPLLLESEKILPGLLANFLKLLKHVGFFFGFQSEVLGNLGHLDKFDL
jgi:hypothetical protein